VIDRTPELGYRAAHLRQLMLDKLVEHGQYICATGEDLPEVCNWMWPAHRSD
jgi:xylulose-5-phosphate/fructose-6-phosphate phosphoketolase